MNEARLRWQCRRGMRELDVLLTRYLQDSYPQASKPEKAAFERLLALSDPELGGYLLKGEPHQDPTIQPLIRAIVAGLHG